MNIKGKAGSKERLFEMMQGVNRTKLNENYWKDELNETLNYAYEKLKSGALKIGQGGSNSAVLQTVGDTSYIGINGYDDEGNRYNFNFRIEGTEGGQDGEVTVQNVVLEKFYHEDPNGRKVFDVNEDDLTEFNKQHGSELYDVIEKYIDTEPEGNEELGETIEKKKESDPYGGSSQDYQDSMGYGDEKPVNPNLRTKAPELEKFVKEEDDEPKKWGEEGKFKDFDGVMKFVTNDELDENEEENGEAILKQNYSSLMRDLDFRKLISAYESILKLKNTEIRQSDVIDKTLAGLRDSIVTYLQNVKGLNVTDMDVQNFFENLLKRHNSIMNENNEIDTEENGEDDVPALDVNDVDSDGDKLEGGLGDDGDMMQYDPQEVLKGVEVEMEHTKDPKIALEIAMDHLEELSDYYTRLEKMENQGEKDLNSLNSEENDSENEIEIDDDVPDELKSHVDDIKTADKELEDTLLGYGTETPNTTDSDDNEKFNRLSSKSVDSLSDDELNELMELWEKYES